MNKRGQGLSTTAIVLIILGVFVLAILIFGFTKGWDSFAPFLSSNNVDSVVIQCQISCSSNSEYNYCSKAVELKADDLPGGVKKVSANCTFFANAPDYADKYGVDKCPGLCPAVSAEPEE